jgi:Ca2+-transporting ATPase
MPSSTGEADRSQLGRLVRHARAARRLRLEVPGLLGDELLARRLERSVSRRDGVAAVRADPRSGRVLITYHAGAGILDELGAMTAGDAAPVQAAREPSRGFASFTVAEALARLASAPEGLAPAEAARRLRLHGRNELATSIEHPWYRILGRQVANVPTALLLGAAAISLILGDVLEAGAIVMVVGLNTAIGYAVERRSDTLLASWQRFEAGAARVLRAGHIETVPAG